MRGPGWLDLEVRGTDDDDGFAHGVLFSLVADTALWRYVMSRCAADAAVRSGFARRPVDELDLEVRGTDDDDRLAHDVFLSPGSLSLCAAVVVVSFELRQVIRPESPEDG